MQSSRAEMLGYHNLRLVSFVSRWKRGVWWLPVAIT
jgi:hypothetical protein